MALKIVTDSLSGISKEVAGQLGITIVPVCINFGCETLKDGIDVDGASIFDEIARRKINPTTSAFSPGEICKIYQGLDPRENEIISIHVSSKLSATYEAALLAADMCGGNIRVIDSSLVAMAQGHLVISAAKVAKFGYSSEQVVKDLKENIPRINFFAALNNLDHAEKSGRIGSVALALAKAATRYFDLKPLLTIKSGDIDFVGAITPSQKINKLLNFVTDYYEKAGIQRLAIEYNTNEEEAEALRQKIILAVPGLYCTVSIASAALSAHVGPYALAVSFLANKQQESVERMRSLALAIGKQA